MKNYFRKEERDILYCSAIAAIASLFFYLICDREIVQDISLATLGLSFGLLATFFANVYIRCSRFKQFLKLYPIEGTYEKYDLKSKHEVVNEVPLKAVIVHQDGLTFRIYNQYGKITPDTVTGYITFSDALDGKGSGHYKWKTKDDSGVYELIAHSDNDNLTIWIRWVNLYPHQNCDGAYKLKKVSNSLKTDFFKDI